MAYHLSMDFSRPDNARRINRLKVLSELRKGTCSKAELSRRLDINKVSIGEICDKMIKEGLIEETGREQTAQGRPGTLLSINSKAGRVFSIEEGRKAFSVAVSDLQGRILRYERLPKGESFQDDIQKLIRKMSAGDAVIYGAAIASDYNTMIELPFPSGRISRAEAEAEAEVARLGDLESFLFISWSDTIAATIRKNGMMIPLPDLPHIRAQRDGDCSCGGKGCLEAVSSGQVILSRTGADSYRTLFGNREYHEMIKVMLRPMAAALSEAVQALSASSVIITGRMAAMPDAMYAYLQTLVSSLLPPGRENMVIYRSSAGENGAREGAALKALDTFFYNTELLSRLKAIENLSVPFQNGI